MGAAIHQRVTPSAATTLEEPIVRHYVPGDDWREVWLSRLLKAGLFASFKPVMRPPVPVQIQRAVMHALAVSMPGVGGVTIRHDTVKGLAIERITPKGVQPRHAILYLHGGAFCVGSPRSHRSITTRLAQAEVFVPHYRRIPEHPYPAQIEDTLQAYRRVLQAGYAAKRVAVAGDSAGGTLSFVLPAAATAAGLPRPAALVLMSPALNLKFDSVSARERAHRDPLIHPSWVKQAVRWLQMPHRHLLGDPQMLDLAAYPPSLVQVGEDEVLHDDSIWAARALAQAGRHAELEVYLKRWHVFQVHGAFLPGAQAALARQVEFMLQHWAR